MRQEAIDEVTGSDTFGLGAVVEDQPVLQGRARQRGDVIDRRGKSTLPLRPGSKIGKRAVRRPRRRVRE
jgi:hypothetical protein